MIDCKSLRVGNIITDVTFQLLYVRTVWADCVAVENRVSYHRSVEIDGIPISPEILESSGLQKRPDGNYYLSNTGEDWYIEMQSKQAMNGNLVLSMPLKYVHQLQNYYYGVMQEEIQINL